MTINTQEDRAKIKASLTEINNSMVRIADEKGLIKDIIDELYDELGLPKKTVRRLAKVYYAQNFNDEVAADTEFELLYQAVILTAGAKPAETPEA